MAGERIVLVLILGLTCLTHGEKVNIALGKPAWTTLGNFPGWTADKAVDGDGDIKKGQETCFHAASSPSDWSVDLGQEYQLYDIRVYIWEWKQDSWKTRTANSTIYLDNNTSRVCHMFPPAAAILNNPTEAKCNDTGRNVTIMNPGTTEGEPTSHAHALNLCEVKIYVCSNRTYGIHCTDSCHCASPPCDRWTGVCSGDCVPGYTGDKCDTICSNTHYGVNCKEKCDDRKCNNNTVSCDHFTGSCDTGCLPGWKGTDCKEECGNQHYGSNCSSLCEDRQCEGNSPCHHVTGSCDNGCKAGWEGTDCTRACINTTYGVNCKEKCVDRKCNTTTASCDHVTGSCDTSCFPGWMGTDCTEECDKRYYGSNCSNHCAHRYCYGNSTCDHVNGLCDQGCKAGWMGNDCRQDCDNQHYGINCKSPCADRNCNGSSSCNNVTGSCDQGCRQGWKGIDCRLLTDSQTEMPILRSNPGAGSSPVPGLVGGIIGAVVLVLFLALVIVLIRRKWWPNHQRGLTKSDEPHIANTNTGQGRGDIYENVALDWDSKKLPAAIAQLDVEAGCASQHSDSRNVDTLQEEEEDDDSPVHSVQQEEGLGLHERNYYNMDDIRRGHVIPVSQLEVRVREFEETPELTEGEFQQLPNTFLHPYDESQKTGNKSKNRFKGYYPYNYNRVVLHDIGDKDYINASYLDGYNTTKRYIAAQGPYKDDIIDDFWRMIWQEGCKVVVMVTGLVEGGKVKCLRYWPDAGSVTYGDVTVTMETDTKLADYTITKLVVQLGKASKKRHVTHFHFTTWPDHGVPDTSCLLQYMWRIDSTSGQQKHPIVVHCSAGIGRTGTYIAVESLVSQATTEGTVDVVSFVSNMRSQRKNMIQTKDQYLFIYQAVMAAVVQGDTSLDADVIRQIDLDHVTDVQMGNKTVQQHLEIMASSAENGTSDDVITIPSYTSRTGFFIKLSRPDKGEVWDQIYNSDSRTLVTWGHVDKSYLPSSDRPVSTSMFTATMHSTSVISTHATLSEVELKKKDNKEGTTIHHYNVTGSVRDTSVSMLIDSLLQWTGQPGCESTTIVSHSISETRLLILLVNITSRLQDDGKVDVISNMRRLQSLLGSPRFTVDDIRLCLEFAQRRLESLGMYANL